MIVTQLRVYHKFRLLLHFSTRAYLFSPDEESCYIFSTRNNCWCFYSKCYSLIPKQLLQVSVFDGFCLQSFHSILNASLCFFFIVSCLMFIFLSSREYWFSIIQKCSYCKVSEHGKK